MSVPTYKTHPDKGCRFAPSCLNCPFPKCKLDELGTGIIRAKKRNRNEEICRRFKQGESVKELTQAFKVSRRTIQRVITKGGVNV